MAYKDPGNKWNRQYSETLKTMLLELYRMKDDTEAIKKVIEEKFEELKLELKKAVDDFNGSREKFVKEAEALIKKYQAELNKFDKFIADTDKKMADYKKQLDGFDRDITAHMGIIRNDVSDFQQETSKQLKELREKNRLEIDEIRKHVDEELAEISAILDKMAIDTKDHEKRIANNLSQIEYIEQRINDMDIVTREYIDTTILNMEKSINAQNSKLETLETSVTQAVEKVNDHVDARGNVHHLTVSDIGARSIDDSYSKTETYSKDEVKQSILDITPRYQGKTKIIAHRGNHARLAENSIGSFEFVNGHFGIETDVRLTKDGHWVCCHDSNINSVTDGAGHVKDLTLAQVQAPKFKRGTEYGKIPQRWEHICLFTDFLVSCMKKNIVPIIEIKDNQYTTAQYDKLVKHVVDFNLERVAVWIAFDIDNLQAIKQRLPFAQVMYLVNSITDKNIADAKALGIKSGVSFKYSDASANLENILKIKNAGMDTGVWTVPQNRQINFISMGVDYITTDDPGSNLPRGKIKLMNGFTEYNAGLTANEVAVTDNGMLAINLTIRNGSNDKGTIIGQLPDDCIPLGTTWATANVRVSSGVATCGVDIIGYSDYGTPFQAGSIVVGFNWGGRSLSDWVTCQALVSMS